MRFRAKIVDNTCIKQFLNIVTVVSKLSKSCILRITGDCLVFIVPDENTIPRRTVLWAVLEQNGFFEHYDMVGVNAADANNEIFLEFNISLLASILSNVKVARSIKMKLTHKTFPALTVEIELPSQNYAENQVCVHEIPITVLPLQIWREYKQPDIVEYDVVIESPPLRKVKNIVDKLKQLSDKITISATNTGLFSLGVNTIPCTVKTLFRNLSVDHSNCSKSSANALVETKRLAQFLTCELMHAGKEICYIVSGNLIHWYLEQKTLQLHYYLTTTLDD
uniref:Checkpoint protein n=2 Tax=Cacopsylla melanoneura TaxID=428564 RepID=A0A8D8M727_9HEMI